MRKQIREIIIKIVSKIRRVQEWNVYSVNRISIFQIDKLSYHYIDIYWIVYYKGINYNIYNLMESDKYPTSPKV